MALSGDSFCGSSVLVQGIEMGLVPVKCDLVSGIFKVGVRHDLPVKGVQFIMGRMEAECCLYWRYWIVPKLTLRRNLPRVSLGFFQCVLLHGHSPDHYVMWLTYLTPRRSHKLVYGSLDFAVSTCLGYIMQKLLLGRTI